MSAERSVSPSHSTAALIGALVIGAALGAGGILLLRADAGRQRRIAATASSPDKSLVAVAWEKPCARAGEWCVELGIGPSIDAAKIAAAVDDPSARCDEVVWTPDRKRVGFVMRGHELRLFDPQSLKEIGVVRLLTEDAARTRRARGVTFSENGRAVTFDDCPREHSGCRAGVMGIPQ